MYHNREFGGIGFDNETGWKIHVSPDFFHCTDVLKIVEDLREKQDFNYRFVNSIYNYIRLFNFNCERAGKFVTIYPKDDKQAKWIVEELNKKFVEKGFDENCFLKVKSDFKVHPGIYVRMSEFRGELDDKDAKGKLCIPWEVLMAHCGVVKVYFLNYAKVRGYEHAFEHLYAHGVKMPKKVCEIDAQLKEIEKK